MKTAVTLSLIGLICITASEIAVSQKRLQEQIRLTKNVADQYQELLNTLFPKANDQVNVKGLTPIERARELMLTLRIIPSFDKETQINIVKYYSGEIEVTEYSLPEASKSIYEYLQERLRANKAARTEELAKQFAIKKKRVDATKELTPLLHRLTTTGITIQPSPLITLDGTMLQFWCVSGSSEIYLSLNGEEVASTPNSVINWIQEVRRVVSSLSN